MIQANELMIGNYVLRNGFLIEDKDKFNHITIGHNDITACVADSTSFKPIPLTEEWLLKFGCIKQRISSTKKNYWNKELDFSIDVEFNLIKDELLYFYLVYNQLRRKPIRYVHQLQNLYFALTQTHLKTK